MNNERGVEPMEPFILWAGRLGGLAGVLFCVAAFAARLGGTYWAAGFQVGTLLQVGIAGMAFGCLCLLWVLVDRRRRR
jgi:hypothetical protein